jgi:putative flavoprotein involved in K+ transport
VAAPDVEVAIIGAGPAGLAVGGALAARRVRATLFERDEVAATWRRHYSRLHIHTMRSLSGLPGRAMPWRYGRFVAREDYVRYLSAYCEDHALDVRTGMAVDRIERAGDGYRLAIGAEVVRAGRVVIATGHNHTLVMPGWAGDGGFRGALLHAAQYRDATSFLGVDVLVVGVGNSGAEIATDLVEGGARSVRVSVRTPPHVVPR